MLYEDPLGSSPRSLGRMLRVRFPGQDELLDRLQRRLRPEIVRRRVDAVHRHAVLAEPADGLVLLLAHRTHPHKVGDVVGLEVLDDV